MYQERDNVILRGERVREIIQVLDQLKQHPIVFVWAPPGNGKTSFGREFKRLSSVKSVFTSPQNIDLTEPLEDSNFFASEISGDTKIIIFDEFAYLFRRPDLVVNNVNQEIRGGRRFVLLVHKPKNSYLNHRRYHLAKRPHIIDLAQQYPDAPWMYLRKWKPAQSGNFLPKELI